MMLTPSHCFLLFNHRLAEQSMNMASIQGLCLCWGTIWLWRRDFIAGSGYRGALMLDYYKGWGLGVQRRDCSQGKSNVCVLWSLETTTSFRGCGFVWIRFGGPYVGPCGVILKLYVCVWFFRRHFPLTQHKSTVNFLNTSHCHCTLSIH